MNWIKGKSYKTVGGWEAMYCGEDKDGSLFFIHYEKGVPDNWWHREDGRCGGRAKRYDVTSEPWTEPRKGEVWVNVYDDGGYGVTSSKEIAVEESAYMDGKGIKTIARVHAPDWQEGVFDE